MTRAAFEEMLDAKPADWTTRIIFADWLEEQGDHVAARGQRWMVRHRKKPYWDYFRKTWDWYYGKGFGSWISGIPINLFGKLRGYESHYLEHSTQSSYREYRTRFAAESALAMALEEIQLEEAANQPYFAAPMP